MRASALSLLCLLMLGAPCAANASAAASVESARMRLGELDFAAARDTAARGIRAGGASPEELVALYALLAESQAALDEMGPAQTSFETVLSLAPDFELPPGASPKLERPFLAARRRLAGARLQISVRSGLVGPDRVRTDVAVTGDVLQLGRSAQLYRHEAGHFVAERMPGGFPTSLTWPCAEVPCAHFVALLDAAGNTLRTRGDPSAALVVEGARPPRADVHPPLLRAATLLAAGAVLAAGTASYFAVQYRNADRALGRLEANPAQARYFTARALDDSRRRDAVFGWSFGVTALGAGVAAAVLW